MAREMKDSGIEWIGEIPADWEIVKGRFIFKQRNSKGNNVKLQLLSPTQKYGVIPQSEYEQLSGMKAVKLDENTDFTTLKTVHKGDYCISLRSFQGGFEYSEYEGVVSPAYQIFYPITDVNRYYFKYMFKDKSFIDKMNSYTMSLRDGKNIAYSDFADSYLPIPPITNQKRIADFLDKKCSQIDTALEKTRTTIEEYKKLKQAIITKAVTKGIRGDRPMKDSGIEWIGEIPTEWGIPKLKYIAKLSSGGTPDRRHHEYWNGNIKWIKTGELQNNVITDSQEYITELALKNSAVILYKPDTILVAMYGQGKTRGMTAFLQTVATTNQACAGIVVKNKNIYPKFIWKYLMGSYIAIREKAQGSGQPNLNISMLADFYVTLPSLKEQQEIVDYLDKKCAAIDTLIAKKEQIITDLEYYKKSLIYEYVTGKKEV